MYCIITVFVLFLTINKELLLLYISGVLAYLISEGENAWVCESPTINEASERLVQVVKELQLDFSGFAFQYFY